MSVRTGLDGEMGRGFGRSDADLVKQEGKKLKRFAFSVEFEAVTL